MGIYTLTDPQHVESTGISRCSDSTCINQLAPGTDYGEGSGSGAIITDDDTSGIPKHVPLVTYLN